MIGAPVFSTFIPRRSPSADPSAIGAHHAVPQLLLHFQRQRRILCVQRQCIEYVRHLLARKLHVDHRTDALHDRSCCLSLCHDYSLLHCPSQVSIVSTREPFGCHVRGRQPVAGALLTGTTWGSNM
jgi:hypothetical protein